MSDENFSEEFIRDIEEDQPETMKLNLEDNTPVEEEQSFSLDDVKDEMHEKQEEVVEEGIPEIDEQDVPKEEEKVVEEEIVPEEPKEEKIVVEEEEDEKPSNKKMIFTIIGVVFFILLIVVGVILYKNDEAPMITMVHIESDNFDDHTIAKYGNKITLTFSSSEDLRSAPKVTINGKVVEVFGEKKEYYAKYFVDNQGMEDITVTFTIEDYKDKLFKKGSPVITTTDKSQVTIKSIIS